MQHAIMMALDQTLLANQLGLAAKKALEALDFEEMIKSTVYRLADEMLRDHDTIEPIREFLCTKFAEAVHNVIPEEKENDNAHHD
jgi:hypothetical protein